MHSIGCDVLSTVHDVSVKGRCRESCSLFVTAAKCFCRNIRNREELGSGSERFVSRWCDEVVMSDGIYWLWGSA